MPRQVLEMTVEDRGALAGALLKSLEPPPDVDVDQAWREEVARRIEAVDAGEMATVPWDELRERLYARLSAMRDV